MRLPNLLCFAALVFATVPALAADPAPDEEALARVPLESYMRGHATGDPAHIRAAFLPTARIDGVRDGKPVSRTLEEFASGFSGTLPLGGSTTIDGRRGLMGLSCTSQSEVLTAGPRDTCSSALSRSKGVWS